MSLFERIAGGIGDDRPAPAEPGDHGAGGSPLRPLPTPKAPRLNRNALTIIAAASGMLVVALVVFVQPSGSNGAARSAPTVPPTSAGTYLDQPLRRPPQAVGSASAQAGQPDGVSEPYAGAPGTTGTSSGPAAGLGDRPLTDSPHTGPQSGDQAVTQGVAYDAIDRRAAPGATTAGAIDRIDRPPREPTPAELRVLAFRSALRASPVQEGAHPVAREVPGDDSPRGTNGEASASSADVMRSSSEGPGAGPSVAAHVLGGDTARAATTHAASGDESASRPPNVASRAQQFMQAAARSTHGARSSQALTVDPAPGPYTVQAGTVIPAVLMTEINSDLPGECLAQITRDVFDSRSQQTLLIPRGAKLLCTYDDQVATGQRRLLVAWTRILLPDGRSITLPGLPATDRAGARGVSDQVDRHARKTVGTAAALSLLSAGAQLAMPQRGSIFSPPSVGQVAAQALGQQLNQVAVQMLQRDLQNRPTIRIRQGTEFAVFLNTDLVFPGPYASGARAAGGLTLR